MHRTVDRITDTHPLVKEAKLLFRDEYRRVAPITLDLVWDHFYLCIGQLLSHQYR